MAVNEIKLVGASGGGGGASTFVDLTDTPSDTALLAGPGQMLQVNATGTALELVDNEGAYFVDEINEGTFGGVSVQVDFDTKANHVMLLTGPVNVQFGFAATPLTARMMVLRVRQDATGGHTLTYVNATGSANIDTAPNAISVVRIYWDGANWYV